MILYSSFYNDLGLPSEQLQQIAGGHYGGESLRKLLLYILTGATVGSQPQLEQWALALKLTWLH